MRLRPAVGAENGTCTFVLPAAPEVSDDAPAPASQAALRTASVAAAISGLRRQGRAGVPAAPTLRCNVAGCLSLSLLLS